MFVRSLLLKSFCTLLLSTLLTSLIAQTNSLDSSASGDDVIPRLKKRNPVPALLIVEAWIIGSSYYASKTAAYGNKVVGWLYAGSSAALLVYLPFYWTNNSNKSDPQFKSERFWNAVTLVGLSYGYSRIARYNLIDAKGDDFPHRFRRNLLEGHGAFFVPIIAGIITEKLLGKPKPSAKMQSSLYIDGSGLRLCVGFR